MALAVGQVNYNGVTLGVGTVFGIVDVDGLTGAAENRNGDVPKPGGDGLLGGYDYMGGRAITMDIEVYAGGGNTMPQNLGLLRAAFLMSTVATGGMNPAAAQILTFNFGEGVGSVGANRQVAARVRKLDVPVDVGFAAMQDPAGAFRSGVAVVAAQLEAVDPLIYDTNSQSASVGLTVAAGGWTFPWTFPWTFTSNTGSFLAAVNSGSEACSPLITITGPCTNPRVQNQTTGVTLQFNTTLAAGDTLVVDCWAGTAVLNGTANRQNTLAPAGFISNFLIQPGSNTVAFYSSDGTVTGATMTLKWANTWA